MLSTSPLPHTHTLPTDAACEARIDHQGCALVTGNFKRSRILRRRERRLQQVCCSSKGCLTGRLLRKQYGSPLLAASKRIA